MKMEQMKLKQLTMKDWFANKAAQAVKHNLHNGDIFAVLKETEKAYYVMLSIEPGCNRCTWVPKSCVEENPGSIDFYTRFGLSYDEAVKETKWHWYNVV